MKSILLSFSILTFFGSPEILYAKNTTGNAPTVVCQAQEVLGGVLSTQAEFTRYNLSMDRSIEIFVPVTVLDGTRFRMQALGSVNSEQELWLRIEDKQNPGRPVYARGMLSAALTQTIDWQTHARITCDNEAELKERYLAEFCNPNGSVRNPEGRHNLEEITRACARLREIEVIKEEPVPPTPPPVEPAPPCVPSPEQPCPAR